MNKEFLKMQKLAGLITESQMKDRMNLNIEQHIPEAMEVLNDFIDEYTAKDAIEFVPELDNYDVDQADNALHISEFGSIYLIPNEGPIPDDVKTFMSQSNDGEIVDDYGVWKKYPKNGYYYVVVS